MDSFTNIATYYDLLMKEVPYQKWLEYYEALLKKNSLLPQSFLDLCCGTGILSELLAERGKQVEGIDLSKSMVQQAKTKAKEKNLSISYYVGDATQFDLGCQYDSIYSFFDSLNYILEREALHSCFKCVFQHLKPEGAFVFDLNTAYAFESNLFDQEQLDIKAPMRYLWKGNYQPEKKVMTIHMDFWVEEKHFKEIHVQRAHDIEEVRMDLEEVGFSSIQFYRSYTYKKPSKYSDRLHVFAIKAL